MVAVRPQWLVAGLVLAAVACTAGTGSDTAQTAPGTGAGSGGSGGSGAGASAASGAGPGGNSGTSGTNAGGAAVASGCITAEQAAAPVPVRDTGRLFRRVAAGILFVEGDRLPGEAGGGGMWVPSSKTWTTLTTHGPDKQVALGYGPFRGASWAATMDPNDIVAAGFVYPVSDGETPGQYLAAPCKQMSLVNQATGTHESRELFGCENDQGAWFAILAYGTTKARFLAKGTSVVERLPGGGGMTLPIPSADGVLSVPSENNVRMQAVGHYHVRVGNNHPSAVIDLSAPAFTPLPSIVFPQRAAAAPSPDATSVIVAGNTTAGFRVVRIAVSSAKTADVPVGNLELGAPDDLFAVWHDSRLWLLYRAKATYGARVIDVDTGALLGRRDDLGPLFGGTEPVVELNGFSPPEILTAVAAPDGTVMAAHQIGPWAAATLRWSPACPP